MKRVLLIFAGLAVVLLGGGYLYLRSHTEVITHTIEQAVASATGKTFALDSPPSLTVFPGLGVELQGVGWGGPEDEISLTCGKALVRVEFWPLLRREIVVSEIALDTPHLVYAARKQAKAPAARGGNAPAAPAPETAGKTQSAGLPPNMKLDVLRVDKGEIEIEQPGQSLRLHNVSLRVADFAPGREGRLEASMRAAVRQKTELSADVSLSASFLMELPRIGLRNVALRIVPVSGLPTTEPLSADGALALNVDTLALSDMQIRLESAGSHIRADGRMDVARGSGALAFSLESAPKRLMAALGTAVSLADAGALQALQASGGLDFDGSRFTLNRLEGKLDDTTFSGEITLATAPDIAVRGKLNLGELRLDRYLPASAPAATGQAPAASDKTASAVSDKGATGAGQSAQPRTVPPALDLALAMERLHARGLKAENIRAALKGKDGRYKLEPCAFRLYDANVSVTGSADLPRQEYALNVAADKLDAGALLREQTGLNDVSGRVNVRADLTAGGPTEAAIRRSLNGTFRLTGQAAFETGLVPKEWTAAQVLLGGISTITLNTVEVTAKAVKGVIDVQPVSLDGPTLKAKGKCVVDLPADTLNGRLTARIGRTDIPLWVEGPLGKPNYGIDAAAVIKDQLLDRPAVQKQMERGAKEVERGVDRLLKKLR
jgi:AsmA protein